jgi:hypothetical protein
VRAGVLAIALAVSLTAFSQSSGQRTGPHPDDLDTDRPAAFLSQFVPLENEAYVAVERLIALRYIDSAFVGLRPWTRSEFTRLTEEAEESAADRDQQDIEAEHLIDALRGEFAPELRVNEGRRFELDDVYVRFGAIVGTTLTDSYHFGQTFTSDNGRPYGRGLNSIIGASASAQFGRFVWTFRGEYQHAPPLPALTDAVRNIIATADGTPIQASQLPAARNYFRILDANVATAFGGMQFTVGKQSFWWGPGESGAMTLSNNAEPIYAIRITRTNPVQLPSLFAYLGPLRFDSFFGRLEGHQFPPDPFFYGQKISFKPTPNLEFGFSRTVVFAGQGVTPLTFSTFFHSFFSTASGTVPGFDPRRNPGARHGGFDFSYRLPGLRRWGVTLYTDSIAHDDVSPVSAPRRASINPGIYIARLPVLRRLEFRGEAVSTDPPTSRSNGGKFVYWEGLYRDAYLNAGNLMGSWIGRESKGGQAWITYAPSLFSRLQVSYRRSKLAKDFIPGGGTQGDVHVAAAWRLRPSVEAKGLFQFEHWNIPALSGLPQSNIALEFELQWLHPLRAER